MDEIELAPVCPGCGEVATWNPRLKGWETFHKRDCDWMLDPDSEPY